MPETPELSLDVLESAMRRALVLAKNGPSVNQNPQVGCVILDGDGSTVAEGWHRGAGTPHAEAMALAELSDADRARANELTAVVTLEPCNHTGRTGPCAQALIRAGIGSVVYGLADPGESSSGGAETLRAAGVRVTGGVLEPEALKLLMPWLAQRAARDSSLPWVTVKWAQTIDGRAAAADGSSQWITGPEARVDVHTRRALADAIVIGTGTLLADDPSLTARNPEGDLLVPAEMQPMPVVIGKRLIPHNANLWKHPRLSRGNTAPIQLRGTDLRKDLAELAKQGFSNVFVEGGPKLISALLRERLVDEFLIYIAPSLLGGPKVAVGDIGIENINDIASLRITASIPLGRDVLIRAMIDHSSTEPETEPYDEPARTPEERRAKRKPQPRHAKETR